MIKLYDYQEISKRWLLEKRRTILGDEFGVGKTFPSIAAACELPRPRLIIAPNYLLHNWSVEIRNWKPDATIAVASGDVPPEQKRKLYTQAGDYDFLLSTYGLIALTMKDQEKKIPAYPELFKKAWSVIIFDEAHRLRSHNTQTTKHAWKLKTESLYLLTGTPIVKDAGDLFPLLKLCNPKVYSSYWAFVQQYCALAVTPWETLVGDVIDPKVFSMNVLQPNMLRRLLREVNSTVPEAVYKPVYLSVTEKTKRAVKKARVEFVQEVVNKETGEIEEIPLTSAMKVTHVVRQLLGQDENQLDALLEIVEDHPTEQTVVWCWYKETVSTVLGQLSKKLKKRRVFQITGDATPKERVETIEQFKASTGGVLVATIAALSYGVNLQTATLTIFYERHMLEADNAQCVARLKRTGQTKTVHVYELLADKTINLTIYKNCLKQRSQVETLLTAAQLNHVYLELAREIVEQTN